MNHGAGADISVENLKIDWLLVERTNPSEKIGAVVKLDWIISPKIRVKIKKLLELPPPS